MPLDGFDSEHTPGDGWDDVLKVLCRSNFGRFARADAIGRFVIRLQAFAHDDVSTLVRDKPAMLRDIQYTLSLIHISEPTRPY